MRKKTEIIIDSINQALLKLHNYDKQLIRFEETFAGSAIVLVIIFGILLTVLLWLQRLSYVLPNGTSQNYVKFGFHFSEFAGFNFKFYFAKSI